MRLPKLPKPVEKAKIRLNVQPDFEAKLDEGITLMDHLEAYAIEVEESKYGEYAATGEIWEALQELLPVMEELSGLFNYAPEDTKPVALKKEPELNVKALVNTVDSLSKWSTDIMKKLITYYPEERDLLRSVRTVKSVLKETKLHLEDTFEFE